MIGSRPPTCFCMRYEQECFSKFLASSKNGLPKGVALYDALLPPPVGDKPEGLKSTPLVHFTRVNSSPLRLRSTGTTTELGTSTVSR